MIAATALIKRLQSIMPEGVQPKFTTAEDLMAWHRREAKAGSLKTIEQNNAARLQRILGRSGISELYQNCSFQNYVVDLAGQQAAKTKAKAYADNFNQQSGNFIFSGSCGTGKNHLAAAIGNQLIQQGETVLIATIPDLMMRLRDTYNGNSKLSESSLMDNLCNVGLLVLDDVGVQRGNTNEGVVLFQIIDRRISSRKPVGILTNLNMNSLAELLGNRVMDRMRTNNSIWINFDWQSYRGGAHE